MYSGVERGLQQPGQQDDTLLELDLRASAVLERCRHLLMDSPPARANVGD